MASKLIRYGLRVSVSAHSAGAYTATLLVMVNVIRGGGRAPPTRRLYRMEGYTGIFTEIF